MYTYQLIFIPRKFKTFEIPFKRFMQICRNFRMTVRRACYGDVSTEQVEGRSKYEEVKGWEQCKLAMGHDG